MSLKIGDRVRCSIGNHRVRGKEGTIVEIRNAGMENLKLWYVVGFDEHINGHDCNGRVTPGHGWYINEGCLELLLYKGTIGRSKLDFVWPPQ